MLIDSKYGKYHSRHCPQGVSRLENDMERLLCRVADSQLRFDVRFDIKLWRHRDFVELLRKRIARYRLPATLVRKKICL